MMQQSTPFTKLKFIEPMYARLINELPEGKDWLYEVKLDGYRCLGGRDSTGVTSGPGEETLHKAVPSHCSACERLAPGTLVDGEIVALDESGRVSFNLLQHHRSKAQALLFYVFDVLSDRGQNLLELPLSKRYEGRGPIFTGIKAAQ